MMIWHLLKGATFQRSKAKLRSALSTSRFAIQYTLQCPVSCSMDIKLISPFFPWVSYKEVKYSDQSPCCNFLSSCSWNWLLPLQYCSILKSDEVFKFQIEHQIRAHIDIIAHWLLNHSICICDVVSVPANLPGKCGPQQCSWTGSSNQRMVRLAIDRINSRPTNAKNGHIVGSDCKNRCQDRQHWAPPFFHSICHPLEIYFCHTFSCIHPSVCALKICWLNGCHQDIFFVTSQS